MRAWLYWALLELRLELKCQELSCHPMYLEDFQKLNSELKKLSPSHSLQPFDTQPFDTQPELMAHLTAVHVATPSNLTACISILNKQRSSHDSWSSIKHTILGEPHNSCHCWSLNS